MPILYLVVPCYNEEAVFADTNVKLITKLTALIHQGKCDNKSRILYVDDGSRDRTWEYIEQASMQCELVTGVKLAHNSGHQNALMCGLMLAKEEADCVISLDADLQDDIEAIDEMLYKFSQGYDIVFGVRNNRDSDSSFKRNTAGAYYKIMKKIGTEMVPNHADYRLMSKRALELLSNYKDTKLFLRGIVPKIGLKTDVVYYKRLERLAGETKYPLHKMLNFAIDGITSLTVMPIRLITLLGALVTITGVVFFGINVIQNIINIFSSNLYLPANFTITSVWLVGGMIILCIGILGEYIGKIFVEVKGHPRYEIDKTIGRRENEKVE